MIAIKALLDTTGIYSILLFFTEWLLVEYQATALSVLGLNGSNGSNGDNGSSGRQQIGKVTDGRSCR